jgi:hypothetical protein
MIGKPGCGVIQSNGQPTAQNTRETGCDGDFPGFRNWQNPQHIEELARVWNVEPYTIPAWGPPTHALQIFRLAEEGPSSSCGSSLPTRPSPCRSCTASAASWSRNVSSSWSRMPS